MQVTARVLANGSVHLRLYADGVDTSKNPKYLAHTVLEPDGKGGCTLNGLDSTVNTEAFRKSIEIARSRGFDYVEFTRVKNGVERVKRFSFTVEDEV